MAKPVLVVVDDEDTSLQALTRELESRYGAHYQVVSGSSAEMALARLAELKAAGADVPLVLADQRLPGMSGTQLLARVRHILSHGPARAVDHLGRPVDARAVPGGGGAGAAGVLPEQAGVVTGRAVPPGDHRIAGGVVARAGQAGRAGDGDRGRSLGPGPRDPRPAGPQQRPVRLSCQRLPGGPGGVAAAGREPIPLGRCCRWTPGSCWWTRPTPRWPRRSDWTCGPPGRFMTWSSSGPGRPGRRSLRGVGGAFHRAAGAGGVRRPGRDELTDQELPGIP